MFELPTCPRRAVSDLEASTPFPVLVKYAQNQTIHNKKETAGAHFLGMLDFALQRGYFKTKTFIIDPTKGYDSPPINLICNLLS